MRLYVAIVLAVLCGVAVGAGTAFWRLRQVPWSGDPVDSAPRPPERPAGGPRGPAPKVAVDQEEYDFGAMDYGAEGEHEFIFKNVGDAPLELTAGPTTCRCTVSEVNHNQVLPGESFKVKVRWKGREVSDEYRQTVQIYTNDPGRPTVELAVVGEVVVAVRANPSELVFSQLSQDEPASGEVRLLCSRPERLEIRDFRLADPELAKFFAVSRRPLSAAELGDRKDARSGVLLTVSVKPGLPQGAFRQTILLRTNLKSAPSFSLDVEGTVGGDITVAGEGWNAVAGAVNFGFVSPRSGAQRRLILVARGPHAKEVQFKLVRKEPELLHVTLEKTAPIGAGSATQTPLIIQIPKGSPPTNCLGSDQGKLGQIILETNLSRMPQVRISARFLIEEE
jgi:hypothetical protein